MKNHLQFMRVIVTLIVVLISANVAKPFSCQNQEFKKEVRRSVFVMCVSEPGLPISNSRNKNTSHVKALASFISQPTSYSIHLNQLILCPFIARFVTQSIRKYPLFETSTFHSFIRTLFGILISPNAP